METIAEALRLLKRQAEIQNDLRRSRDNPLLAERELFLIRNRLAQFPAAVQAITLTANELHRPVDTLSAGDVEKRCGRATPLGPARNTACVIPSQCR
jgi:hypothetical protein